MIDDRNKRLVFTAWVIFIGFLSGLTGATLLFYIVVRLKTEFPTTNIVVQKTERYTVIPDDRWSGIVKDVIPSILLVVKNSKEAARARTALQTGSESDVAQFVVTQNDIVGHALVVTNDGWVVVPSSIVSQALRDQLVFINSEKKEYVGVSFIGDSFSGVALVRVSAQGSQGLSDFKPIRFPSLNTFQVGTSLASIGFDSTLLPRVVRGDVIGVGIRGQHDKLSAEETYRYPIVSALGVGALMNGSGEAIALIGPEGPIPLYPLKARIGSMLSQNKIVRVSVGITYNDQSTVVGRQFIFGARVVSVKRGSPAYDAGIQSGDVITRVDDFEVHSLDDLSQALVEFRPGQTVHFDYVRGSDHKGVDIKLGTL